MHLKKLELAGFKSFADRISLDFGPGMNAVVGPNGSGKSNIADALRWVLGEQSAKQLRGGKMEDIIFAGTAHRKPLGYAEITMRLDNTDKRLPLEQKEISVTRRVYRSGESEYLINGEACRLKDIAMLFMDTGVGRDGYSIIGQGRIDEILSLRSEDRRHVFEEAAGISKYKSRRTEALNKLERERENRARVDDIIAELDEQLEPLESQSEEARRYLELRDEYKSVHLNIFLADIRKINDDMEHTEKSLESIMSQSGDGKRLLTEARSAGEELKNRAAAADANYRRATEDLLDTTKIIEQKQTDIKLAESRCIQLETDSARLKTEAEKRDSSIAGKHEEISAEEENVSAMQSEVSELNHALLEQLEISARHENAMREGAAETDSLNQNVMDAMTAATESRAAVLEAENMYRRLEDDKERLDTEIERHEDRLEEATAAFSQNEGALNSCGKELSAALKNQEDYAKAYNQLRAEADTLQRELRITSEDLTAKRGRFRALSDLEAGHEGYYRSVKAVLSRQKTDAAFAGICGAVGELIGVEDEFETAIEIALGGAAQNIITKTEGDAKHAIEFLKRAKEGRATFLPLTAVKGRNIDTYRLQNEQGYIGIAAELVDCEDVYAPVISQLLGDIVIMDTLENALALHKKFRYSYKIVTKGGERLSPGGAITGGSVARQSAGIIGRARQLEQLKIEVTELQRDMEILNRREAKLNEKRATTRDVLAQTNETVSTLQLEEKNLRAKQQNANETLKTLQENSQNYNEENEKIMARIVEANGAVRVAKTELLQKEELVENARAALENYQRETEQNRKTITEEADAVTELRVEITRKTEVITHSKSNISRLQKEISTLEQEKKMLLAEISANETAIKQSQENRQEIAAQLEKIQSRLEESRKELTASEAEKNALDAAIAKAEADERSQTDATNLLEREIARLEARKESLDASSHRLHNEVWEEYGLTYQTAMQFKREDLTEATLRKTGSQLKSELAGMTDVNLGAIEAFKQIKTRHGFLTTQRDDILEAEAALNELIANLTAEMENRFAEKFAVIAEHFSEVFKEMFEGGKASLRLLDTENVLESGIEIIAQPPGKSLQNLMLLSGGERALTAITLLFSILRMKPSPFCVLDEIESALDDANVARFANFLKQYAKGTQFIIITHRKGTMEAADTLYGVTMEEQGVSKMVSVKIVEESDTKY
ncbi:MAG: chromosome segregation protein SMC [Defluviitaleaceae bacterium]|nr:chromosome segregation protein SMC [Defluviitaleaceae bacterium]MCL2262347.1 chromosome segregation protein SMC [Defluviitaleaceae bacterium]